MYLYIRYKVQEKMIQRKILTYTMLNYETENERNFIIIPVLTDHINFIKVTIITQNWLWHSGYSILDSM